MNTINCICCAAPRFTGLSFCFKCHAAGCESPPAHRRSKKLCSPVPDFGPRHEGGTITETSETDTVYYGICKCGWQSPILRYAEIEAFSDFADHIGPIVEADWKKERRK